MEIETLQCDGITCSFMTKGEVSEDLFKKTLIEKDWTDEESLKDSKYILGWVRKSPVRDESNEYVGWTLIYAEPNTRGAFLATQINIKF